MGYRSDVALALTCNGVKFMQEKLVLADPETRQTVERWFAYADSHELDAETASESWYWSDLKWYVCDPQNYPDIDFIDRFMGEMPEEDFYFVRIGEGFDDNDIQGEWRDNPFGIRLSRKIAFGK